MARALKKPILRCFHALRSDQLTSGIPCRQRNRSTSIKSECDVSYFGMEKTKDPAQIIQGHTCKMSPDVKCSAVQRAAGREASCSSGGTSRKSGHGRHASKRSGENFVVLGDLNNRLRG